MAYDLATDLWETFGIDFPFDPDDWLLPGFDRSVQDVGPVSPEEELALWVTLEEGGDPPPELIAEVKQRLGFR